MAFATKHDSLRHAKVATSRTSNGVFDNVDDLYDTNAFEDDGDPACNEIEDKKLSSKSGKSVKTQASVANGPSRNKSVFDVWVNRKDKYERTVDALHQLDINRAADDAQWFEVAVCLAATDCAVKIGRIPECDCPGICRDRSHAVVRQRTRCQCPAKKCAICNRCINTTPGSITDKMLEAIAPYAPANIQLANANPQQVLELASHIIRLGEGRYLEGSKICSAVLRMANLILQQCSVRTNENGKPIQRPCNCPLRSLAEAWTKWSTNYHTFAQAKLTKAEADQFSSGTKQMMDYDESTQTYYMTLKWHRAAKPQKGDTAKIAARRALTADQKKQNALFLKLCKRSWAQAQERVAELLQQRLSKLTDADEEDNQGSSKPTRSEIEMQVLHRIGIRRLLQWVEEDRETIANQKQEEQRDKLEGGVVAHRAWANRKDRLRVRLPDQEALPGTKQKPSKSRFDFSTGKGVVRPKKVDFPSTTVEIMQNSGLKYVHAMNEGFQGRGGDLEKCRELLKKKGYLRGGKNNDAKGNERTTKQDREQLRKLQYEAWITHKALEDKAVKFMQHIPKPLDMSNVETLEHSVSNLVEKRWEDVGRALKAVDRGLLETWISWTDGYHGAGRCRMLWESFPPIACDVHCTSSPIRDVFLKLIHRQNTDYKAAFMEHCSYKVRKAIARGEEELEDMTEEEQAERFAKMTPVEFVRLLRDLGIVLQTEEASRMATYFDTDGDGSISMTEFLQVVGDFRHSDCVGDTDVLLKNVCAWETVCHECGMLNAFQLTAGTTSSSSVRMRCELPGHAKRRALFPKRFPCHPEADLHHVKEIAPDRCSYAKWTNDKAIPFLKQLEIWSAEAREQLSLHNMVESGRSPAAPTLFRDEDDSLDPTTSLYLRWSPAKVDGFNGAAFYILESMGAEGSTTFRNNEYKEIYRDPKDYLDNDGKPRYKFVVRGLQPSTKYGFRLRAFNGFGASPYTIGYYFTNPATPPAPSILATTANSITVGWETESYYRRQLKELRKVFEEADADGNGQISRDEFMEEVERRKPRLLAFLQAAKAPINVSSDNLGQRTKSVKAVSVFDAIETDDNELISWEEFVQYFRKYVDLLDTTEGDAEDSNKANSAKQKKHGWVKASHADASRPYGGCRYILKQCTHESDGEYVEIYRGTNTRYTIHGLASGSTFQFRVQAYNEEDLYSLHSEPVIANTLLQTPSAPSVVTGSIAATSLKLKWESATSRPSLSRELAQLQAKKASSSAKVGANLKKARVGEDSITRILKEWANETSIDEGSIDYRARFDRYDVDKSGYIELPEFKTMLEELGVAATDERLAAYLDKYDLDNDGRISFSEFAKWWDAPDVQYVVKRDVGDVGSMSELPRNDKCGMYSPDQMKIVSYRGTHTSSVISGLVPNTFYKFRLRTVSAHASSQLSDSLGVWTAPDIPSSTGRISVLSVQAQIRWYPGENGAYKYIVERKFIETLDPLAINEKRNRPRSPNKADDSDSFDWLTAYEGVDTIIKLVNLKPNSVYRLRVFAVNRNGVRSEQSMVTQMCTTTREEEKRYGILRPSAAADQFPIECERGDLVVGDTALFSERLIRLRSGKMTQDDGTYDVQVQSQTHRLSRASSITSYRNLNESREIAEAVGERTVAARVTAIRSHEKHGRLLTLQVVYCTVHIQDAGQNNPPHRLSRQLSARSFNVKALSARGPLSSDLILPTDLKVTRREKVMFRHDVFRTEWIDEDARRVETWDR